MLFKKFKYAPNHFVKTMGLLFFLTEVRNMKMRKNSHLLDYNSIYFQNNNVHSACNIVPDRIPTLIKKKGGGGKNFKQKYSI